jgi:dihydroxyacetone kinase DhaKLM complex PTS-EIIA-like component DhaM
MSLTVFIETGVTQMNANTSTDRAIRNLNRENAVKRVASLEGALAEFPAAAERAYINKTIAAHKETIRICDEMTAAGF